MQHHTHSTARAHVARSPRVVHNDHGNFGCAITALIVGLLLFRVIPWLGGLLTLVGGILLVQVIGSFGAAVWIVLTLIVIGFVVVVAIAATRQVKADVVLRDQPLVPIHPAGIVSRPGETFYLETKANWSEYHSERRYTGGYGGVSVRIAKGLSVHSGSTRGRSQAVRVVSKTPGVVYLSDKRIVFLGGGFSREVLLRSAIHFGKGPNFVQVDLPNKPSVEIGTKDGTFGTTLDKVLRGTPTESPAAIRTDTPPARLTTKQSNVTDLIAALDKVNPDLEKAYAEASTTPPAPVGATRSLLDSINWMGEMLGQLGTKAKEIQKVFVTDLTTVLTSDGTPEQKALIEQRWIREYAKFYNELIDWEFELKAANLDARCATAQSLMRGLSGRSFHPVLELRGKLANLDFAKGSTPQMVDMNLGSAPVGPIVAEIKRISTQR
jgi:hypothetical protein